MESLFAKIISAEIIFISFESYHPTGYKIYDNDIDPFTEHTHSYSTITIVNSLSGNCDYIIDGKSYSAHPGQVILINSKVPHYKILSDNGIVEEIHIGLNLELQNIFPGFNLSNDKNHFLFSFDSSFFYLYNSYISTYFSSPFSENTLQNATFQKGIWLLLYSLISHFLDNKSGDILSNNPMKYSESNSNDIILMLYYFINTHYMEKISFSRFAEEHFVNSSYLSRNFKKAYGISPEKLLTKIRMEHAIILLQDHSLSIQKIADSLGYIDSYHFSKTFKKYYNDTPFHYRKTFFTN